MSVKLKVQCSSVRPALFWAVIVKGPMGEVVHPHTIRYTRDLAWKAYKKQFPFPKDAKKKFAAGEARLSKVMIAEPDEATPNTPHHD